ncbi:MAG TPA: FAD binding domain-containing protein [Tetrasphaera sp.]|uniref:FAD binding domain-containing protein n=1 Tax=Nostocoides sp. TaxID=1917966 RepID=UPI002C1B23B0|nr:FAD binding domain-containing protein [Tetrasphaera sp.]HNQ06875.1 FAD binding domain-containing protein [Tetrasphaera sp.]
MKPAPFAYHAPRSLDEAVAVLGEVGHDGKVLAGGQSLIPMLSMRLAAPAHLIDINQVAGLDTVTVTEDAVRVGATVRHRDVERSDEAYAALPLLRQALLNVAHPAIRNRGTTVGSIAHADAAGEMPSIAVLTDAIVEVQGPAGAREISAHDFFAGPLEIAIGADEVVVAVRFGRFPSGTRTGFTESARRRGDYALAGVGVALTCEEGAIRRARAAYVSVTDIPDVLDLTGVLAGATPADLAGRADDLIGAVRAHVQPESDIHASADYRRMLAGELTRRLVAEVMAR